MPSFIQKVFLLFWKVLLFSMCEKVQDNSSSPFKKSMVGVTSPPPTISDSDVQIHWWE